MKKKKVLWIEDSAFEETAILASPVYLSGKFDLDIAISATHAMNKLASQVYEAVVVDIRIPPGEDQRWKKEYYGSNKGARLGLVLLRTLLRRGGLDADFGLPADDEAPVRDYRRYGVLSVESEREIGPDLAELGVYHFDKASAEATILLTVIDSILRRYASGGNGNGSH